MRAGRLWYHALLLACWNTAVSLASAAAAAAAPSVAVSTPRLAAFQCRPFRRRVSTVLHGKPRRARTTPTSIESSTAPRAAATAPPSLTATLQACVSPREILHVMSAALSRSRPQGNQVVRASSGTLVRLSKYCVTWHNQAHISHHHGDQAWCGSNATLLATIVECLATSARATHASRETLDWNTLIEGTKALAILARLDSTLVPASMVLWDTWTELLGTPHVMAKSWDASMISGLHWAWRTWAVVNATMPGMPPVLDAAHVALDLPFHIVPAALNVSTQMVAHVRSEVDFQVDDIFTTALGHVVPERRGTAWQGDATVGPFVYSGKTMPRQPWSRTVRDIRDALLPMYFDACLLNLYDTGASAMRYHSDPDQGTLWDYETAVVSLGATRRFAFRPIHAVNATEPPERPHSFVVFHSDVTYMFGKCQERYQHAVKNADTAETSPRISLVFKRSWNYASRDAV